MARIFYPTAPKVYPTDPVAYPDADTLITYPAGENFALNAPTLAVEDGVGETHVADEGDELTVLTTVDDGDGSTTTDVELYLNGALVDSMDDDGGGDWSYALTDVLPGSHTYRAKRITAEGFRWSATWLVTVTAEVPSLDAPLDAAVITIGDPLTFEATGTVDGFDANTSKMEFYVESVLRATANTDTAGVWTEDWDTTGATPAVGQAVVARRYWLGVSGQAGTADSADDVEIELDEGAAPALVSAVIDAAGTLLTLTYDQNLDTGSVPALGDLDIDGPVLAVLVGTPGVSGMTVTCSISPAVIDDEVVTVDYTPGASPIQNLAGLDAAALVAQAVTNNSTHTYDPRDETSATAVCWVSFLDSGSFTEAGGVVTALTEKISSTALTLVGSPAYSATAINGHPGMDLSGTTQYALGTQAACVAAGVDAIARTLILVVQLDTPDRVETMFGWGNSGVASNGTWSIGQGTTLTGRTRAEYTNDAGSTNTLNGNLQTDTTAHIYSAVSPGTTIATTIDEAADLASTTHNPGTLTPNRFAIGCRPDSVPDRFLDGKVGEVWIFSGALSAPGLARVEAYLTAAWGTP